MKLALDNQVGKTVAKQLEQSGYTVVYHAQDEMDQVWLPRARDKGADVFISPDWDVDFFCNRHNKKCIRLKQGQNKQQTLTYILKNLERIKNNGKNTILPR